MKFRTNLPHLAKIFNTYQNNLFTEVWLSECFLRVLIFSPQDRFCDCHQFLQSRLRKRIKKERNEEKTHKHRLQNTEFLQSTSQGSGVQKNPKANQWLFKRARLWNFRHINRVKNKIEVFFQLLWRGIFNSVARFKRQGRT